MSRYIQNFNPMKNLFFYKTTFISICVLLSSNLRIVAQSESEPNNTYQTANTLAVNSTTSGTVGLTVNSTTDFDDWFMVTLPSDGKIQIIETTTAALYSGINVYDADGSYLFDGRSGKKGGSDTLTYNYRAAGVYYIKVTNWSSSYGSYTLKANFFPATLTNDVEPNDVYSQAKDLAINTETTGHLGFRASATTDYDDWFKVTLSSAGKLKIIESTTSDLYSGIYLYESNGSSLFDSKSGKKGGPDTLTYNYRTAGVFYIKLSNWSSSYGSYTLKANYYPGTSVTNPNDDDFIIIVSANSEKMTIKNNNMKSIEIFNLIGKNVYSKNNTQLQDIMNIDISAFSKGIYMIKISDNQKNSQTKKIVIR